MKRSHNVHFSQNRGPPCRPLCVKKRRNFHPMKTLGSWMHDNAMSGQISISEYVYRSYDIFVPRIFGLSPALIASSITRTAYALHAIELIFFAHPLLIHKCFFFFFDFEKWYIRDDIIAVRTYTRLFVSVIIHSRLLPLFYASKRASLSPSLCIFHCVCVYIRRHRLVFSLLLINVFEIDSLSGPLKS